MFCFSMKTKWSAWLSETSKKEKKNAIRCESEPVWWECWSRLNQLICISLGFYIFRIVRVYSAECPPFCFSLVDWVFISKFLTLRVHLMVYHNRRWHFIQSIELFNNFKLQLHLNFILWPFASMYRELKQSSTTRIRINHFTYY